jgi:hypothetical protein
MKLTNIRLYEQAGDAGAGGGGGGGGAGGGQGAGAAGASGGGGAAGVGAGDSLLAGAGQGSGAAGAGGQGGGAAGAGGGQQQQAEAGAGAGTSWFTGLYDATGKINAAKFDALPEHLKGHKDLFARYHTVEALMGGLATMSSLAGKKALAPLPDGASPEAKAERSKLMAQLNNVPEKPEGYGFKKPDSIPEEHWNKDYANGVAAILHKHNVSPEAAKELMEFDAKQAGTMLEKVKAGQAQADQAEMATLKETFGADMPKHLDLAVRAVRTAGMDPNDKLFKNAGAVILAAKFGAMISEDRLVSGDSTPANAGMDDRAKALDIVNNAANPLNSAYHKQDHPRHTEAVEAVSRFNQAYHAKKK